ncbi:GGDEF domain-containing protein [Actinoplanes sp. NPDC024001]|uniref:GGDEF domain-containing protein n=1 Tax=Actinoplanes sp. NPDC024001 TaxID=3154598 RepID=UPI0033CC869F
MSGRTFGILSPFVGGDYYGAIIEGITAAAVAGGDRVLAIQTLNPGAHSADRSGLPDFDRPVAWDHLSGLVVLPGAVAAGPVAGALRAGLPTILVAQEAATADASVVLADNRSGVRAAVRHLVEHGHERIAFGGFLAHFDLRERHEGYREGLLAHGLTPQPELLFDTGDNHESGGEAVADALIRAGMPASAIVLGTDRNAIGLIGRMTAAGYDLPAELAVVGFDDIPDAAYLRPALSSVRQPLDDVGAAVYKLLQESGRQQSGRQESRPQESRPQESRPQEAGPQECRPQQGRLPQDDGPLLESAARIVQVPTVFQRRNSCGCPSTGLPVSEPHTRSLFSQVQYLQSTLNIQYELGLSLLGTREHDARTLDWLGLTPAVAGCLGLWPAGVEPAAADRLELVGEFRIAVGAPDAVVPVSRFPPAELLDRADGAAGDIVFVVPVRTRVRDWGLLAAVGRIQATTPPGREMMNHSGALLATALDYRVLQERLRTAALHDHLTGLPNRLLLEDRLNRAGARAAREAGYRFAVLLLDLDGFKAINDGLGHAAGDALLVEVARRLTGLVRRTDTVARLGGDEFVVLIDGLPEPDAYRRVCDAVQAAVTAPVDVDGQLVQVGVSIGVAVSGDGAVDPDHLLREADAAMYRVKSATHRR